MLGCGVCIYALGHSERRYSIHPSDGFAPSFTGLGHQWVLAFCVERLLSGRACFPGHIARGPNWERYMISAFSSMDCPDQTLCPAEAARWGDFGRQCRLYRKLLRLDQQRPESCFTWTCRTTLAANLVFLQTIVRPIRSMVMNFNNSGNALIPPLLRLDGNGA
jgi:hypothetical protein